MKTPANDIANRSVTITKLLPAPVGLVWQVWTDPKHIATWWGPEGFTNTIHTMDVLAGGEWRLTMHGPDGKNFPNRSVFLDIVPEEKIVFQHFHPNYFATILFKPEGDKTRLDWTLVFETVELFETVVNVFKADEGLLQNVDKLQHYLQSTFKDSVSG